MTTTAAISIFVSILSLLGPAPSDTPKDLQLKPGDSIVAIGDSITAFGGDAKHPDGYLHLIDAVLTQQYPELKTPPVVNKGVSGQVAEDLIKRFDRDVVQLKPKPAFVTISVGINDVWHRLENRTTHKPLPHDPVVLDTYTKNVSKMVDMAQAAGIRVILLTPTVIHENPKEEGNQRLLLYVEAEKKIAAEKHCQLVDLHQMFLDLIAQKPKTQKGTGLTVDGVHMKPLGNAVMAIGVLRALGVPDDKIAATIPPEDNTPPAAPTSRPAPAAK